MNYRKYGVGQLPKALQNSVRIRVDEDREQAVRRFVHEKEHMEAAALIDAVHVGRVMAGAVQVGRVCGCESARAGLRDHCRHRAWRAQRAWYIAVAVKSRF